MWKKSMLLFLAAMLLLVGCSTEASLVRESTVKTLEVSNYDFSGTLKLTGDLEKLLEESGEELDEQAKALLAALHAGVKMEGSQLDLNRSKFSFIANDDKVLRDNNLWTGDQPATLNMLIDSNAVYIGTPIDDKYIVIDNTESLGEDIEIDPAVLKDMQDKLNELALDFVKSYISKYGFNLSNVTNKGEQTVELPNGDKVTATQITIEMDTKELINLLLYTAKDATANQDVRKFIIDFMALMASVEKEVSGESTIPTDRQEIEKTVDEVLAQMKEAISQFEAMYTVDDIVQMGKEFGLESVNLNMDYFIDKDKFPVYTTNEFSVTINPPTLELSEPITIGLAADQYTWNFNKATSFVFPSADETVTLQQLIEDKEQRNHFNKDGFLYKMFEEMSKEVSVVVLNLNDNTTTVDGEELANVRPIQDKNGTTLVPLRFITEIMGASFTFDDTNKSATLVKDDTRIVITHNSNVANVNGSSVTLPAQATIIDGSFYVPVRFIADQLGQEMMWIDETKEVLLFIETSQLD